MPRDDVVTKTDSKTLTCHCRFRGEVQATTYKFPIRADIDSGSEETVQQMAPISTATTKNTISSFKSIMVC